MKASWALVISVSLMMGCASTAPPPKAEPAPAPVAKPAPPPPSERGLILSGAGAYEVLINGKSHGKLPATGKLKVDLPLGVYQITFVDRTGAVALTTSYEAELSGDGYLSLHHAPR